MTRITSRDSVLLILNEQLTRLATERGSTRTSKTAGKAAKPSLDRLRRIAGAGTLSDDERAGVLIRSILLDAFDESLAADPRFETLADEVARMIRQSDGGDALVNAVFAHLRD